MNNIDRTGRANKMKLKQQKSQLLPSIGGSKKSTNAMLLGTLIAKRHSKIIQEQKKVFSTTKMACESANRTSKNQEEDWKFYENLRQFGQTKYFTRIRQDNASPQQKYEDIVKKTTQQTLRVRTRTANDKWSPYNPLGRVQPPRADRKNMFSLRRNKTIDVKRLDKIERKQSLVQKQPQTQDVSTDLKQSRYFRIPSPILQQTTVSEYRATDPYVHIDFFFEEEQQTQEQLPFRPKIKAKKVLQPPIFLMQ